LLKKIIEKDSQCIESIPPKKNQKQKTDQPRKALGLAFGYDIID